MKKKEKEPKFDTQELIKYMKVYSLKEIRIEELIKNIDRNIILLKK